MDEKFAGRGPSGQEGIYGAIDLGTNNCRLLIVRPRPNGFRVIDAFSRIVRLGQGVERTGALDAAAMDRTLAALKICAEKMARRGVTHVRAVATEACRRAGNGPEFLARVKAETGLELEVIGAAEEAELAFRGCAPMLAPAVERGLIFDIGGGSTEITWVDNGARKPRILAWTSLPLGVVAMAERHGGRAVSDTAYGAIRDRTETLLKPFDQANGIAAAIAAGRVQMIGTSGTVTTLAGIHLGLQRYDRAKVDGVSIARPDLEAVEAEIRAMPYEQRVAHGCVGPGRADLVIAGCAILAGIMRTWPGERLLVADRGLREGLLLTLMAA